MSKGSKPRPFSVSNSDYAARWDAIFQRDLKPEPEPDIITDPAKIREAFEQDGLNEVNNEQG